MNSYYFCTKCKRKHRKSTAIHEKHLNWKEVESEEVPSNKVFSCKISLLPYIAQKQINTYLDKILADKKNNLGKNRGMYIQQINKVILHETNNMLLI